MLLPYTIESKTSVEDLTMENGIETLVLPAKIVILHINETSNSLTLKISKLPSGAGNETNKLNT